MGFQFTLLAFIVMAGVSISSVQCAFTNPCRCTREYLPVCGSNGETYSTKCTLECHNFVTHQKVYVVHNGECEGRHAHRHHRNKKRHLH